MKKIISETYAKKLIRDGKAELCTALKEEGDWCWYAITRFDIQETQHFMARKDGKNIKKK